MSSPFTIIANPRTDIWRKPPTTDIFNGPLPSFLSARVSFLLPSQLRQYDQAGLLLSLRSHQPSSSYSASSSSSSPPKWIKTGVENYNGTPRAATVACDAWADWSLAPVTLPPGSNQNGEEEAQGNWVTVAIERDNDELGQSLWVYQVVPGASPATGTGDKEEIKIPLREICWPFGHEAGQAEEQTENSKWHVQVQAYACRPSKNGNEELEARFRDFEVRWK
ncbi:hypothetical protein BD289DRAFT_478121 [Coniella lustricola]|uniref:Uncharacterized protein n=1 Tax=Coniella lustricola TaxID=2025994 RepID=A0A2T3ANR1_9PEZI|nr:hypothetical protein BD289DRAFT_478121 [Coniella lustricola]